MKTIVAAALLCLALALGTPARAQEGATCSEDSIRQAVQVLQQCGLDIDPYVAPKSCAEVVLERFAVKDAAVVAGICQPRVSGRCLDALLEKFAPASSDVEGGLKRMAESCRDVNPFCAVSLIRRFQGYEFEQIRTLCPARGRR